MTAIDFNDAVTLTGYIVLFLDAWNYLVDFIKFVKTFVRDLNLH